MGKSRWHATVTVVVGITGLAGLSAGSAVPVPEVVSPSGPTAQTCPTFSWAGVPGAKAYELAVFAITPDGRVSDEPSLSARLPSGATSWTPPSDACLEAGGDYGWSIRAIDERQQGEWTEPALIEFAVAPSVADVEAALDTLDRFLVAEIGNAKPEEAVRLIFEIRSLQARTANPPEPSRSVQPSESTVSRLDRRKPSAESHAIPPGAKSTVVQSAAMKVEGEVRTVDEAGEPRLWGRGRPGAVGWGRQSVGPCENSEGTKLRLSDAMVDWGSAADACPAGTWVCREQDFNGVSSCNTDRPDDAVDLRACDGTAGDQSQDEHIGWVADSTDDDFARIFSEIGTFAIGLTCISAPVWCCSEG